LAKRNPPASVTQKALSRKNIRLISVEKDEKYGLGTDIHFHFLDESKLKLQLLENHFAESHPKKSRLA
jgi:hypothetical protein